MLIRAGDFEITENQRNHEDVVDAERLFQDVAHEELNGRFPARVG